MEPNCWQIELYCTKCGWRSTHDAAGVAEWLRGSGRLRCHSEATPDELRELALALAPKSECPNCGGVGLIAKPVDDEADWPQARRCDACGKPIAAERLEVFPDATLCAPCQQGEERGEQDATGEFCPKCGWPMVVKPSRGAGIRRYLLVCSKSPPCRGTGRGEEGRR
ncbi:MAG TPA: TraR/DksA C4-type zinc finger protein [Pirellulales bacterium]|jgi:ssDNA-binding Zn-finger/Zn-ribbon topoisomerase 1|nr:TraR/DksA C4-type zinc finger protein [Pirellulales bacterium]